MPGLIITLVVAGVMFYKKRWGWFGFALVLLFLQALKIALEIYGGM